MYKNCMELLVEMRYEEMEKSLDCCKCQKCRDDIFSLALNRLPTKYVSTQKGEVFLKSSALNQQYYADITSALTQAAEIVRQSPRHW